MYKKQAESDYQRIYQKRVAAHYMVLKRLEDARLDWNRAKQGGEQHDIVHEKQEVYDT